MSSRQQAEVEGAWKDAYDKTVSEVQKMRLRRTARDTLRAQRPDHLVLRKGDRLTLRSGVVSLDLREDTATTRWFGTSSIDERRPHIRLFPGAMELQIARYDQPYKVLEFSSGPPVDLPYYRQTEDLVDRLIYPPQYAHYVVEDLMVFRLPKESLQTLRLDAARAGGGGLGAQTPFLHIPGFSAEQNAAEGDQYPNDMFFLQEANAYPPQRPKKYGHYVADSYATPWSVMIQNTVLPPVFARRADDTEKTPLASYAFTSRTDEDTGLVTIVPHSGYVKDSQTAYRKAAEEYRVRTGSLDADKSLQVMLDLEWRDKLVFRNYGTRFGSDGARSVETDILVEVVLPQSVKESRTKAVVDHFITREDGELHGRDESELLPHLKAKNDFGPLLPRSYNETDPNVLAALSEHPDLEAADVFTHFGGTIVEAFVITKLTQQQNIELSFERGDVTGASASV